MTTLRMLLVGGHTTSRWEQTILQTLGNLAAPHLLLCHADSISQALSVVVTDEPDLVVVIQSYPDQYSATEAQQLLSHLPLTRLIVCHGPWCSGDGRNRDIWPLATRVSHTGLFPRLSDEIDALTGFSIALPWTAGRDEIASWELSAPVLDPETPFTFFLDSADSQFQKMLGSHLLALGGRSVPLQDTDLLLIDIDPWSSSMSQHIADLVSRATPCHTFLLTGSPDAIPTEVVEGAGPARVIEKLSAAARPRQLRALLAQLPQRRSA